ncbi:MAG: Asp-tRNA(Asn)/Glu-tRNA(Gln) amidotransferase subunit GatA [Nocardioidaceae bacterium]|nr:Asp-tRNA(Asn)/Glu-tRNA(Gln) amidotransferase subunit GatA [Nocardioidaceae bacterium]
MGTNISELSLAAASAAVASRELSPVELVDACLERIDDIEALRAYIAVYAEESRQVARAAEAMMKAGHRLGPLHGLPIALKDNIAIEGKVTTAGSKILADWKPDQDATVARKLKGAGAIIIGKTNQHEFAWGGTSANPHYGAVRNPWNPEHFPAGSSGGSGVAVAARTCYGALGTDTGGSVRLPAAVNGIAGLRPTIGRVSNAGVIPLAWSMDTVGPMARTVEDCAVMFNAIAGHDPRDPGSSQTPTQDYTADLERDVKGLRIGVISDYFFEHLQKPVHDAVREAITLLESAGAQVIEVAAAHIHGNISAQLTIESAEPSAYHQRWLRERPDDYGDDVRLLLEVGEMLLATHYIQAQRYRAVLRSEFLDAFKSVDVFICPTLPFTATAVGETLVEVEEGAPEDMLSAIMQFTGVPSLTGLPSLNVPCGFDDGGLPIGMQVIGRPFDESTLFRVGAAYQRNTDFHERTPVVLG